MLFRISLTIILFENIIVFLTFNFEYTVIYRLFKVKVLNYALFYEPF